mgnify:CR=1 FL=1
MDIDPKIHERLKEINTKLTDIEKQILSYQYTT